MNTRLNAAAKSRGSRVIGTSVAAALTLGGVGLLAAPGAQATTDPPVVISAPSAVWSGKAFTLRCNIKPTSVGRSWAGLRARVQEKGLPVHASRTIGKNGQCTMRLVLNARGNKQIRVKTYGANNVLYSSWIKIRVK